MSRFLSIAILSVSAIVQPMLLAQVAVSDAYKEGTYEEGVKPSSIPQSYRTRIFRRYDESVSVPDVLVLKSGGKIEAYFLEAYRDFFVFYTKESDFTWVRDTIDQSAVATVLREQYLPQDPSRTQKIRRARKQPVAKQSVMAGTHNGWQDRNTRWKFTFRSEVNKPLTHTEDATEYGRFVLESEHRMPGGGYANRTRAFGQYYLFAPNTVNNTEWVLNLIEVSYSETDYAGQETRLQTTSLIDDTLIVEFAESGDRFRLYWSNLSSRALAGLPQVDFRRAVTNRTPAMRMRQHTSAHQPRVQLIGNPAPAAQWAPADEMKATAAPRTRLHLRSPRSRRAPRRINRWKRPASRWR